MGSPCCDVEEERYGQAADVSRGFQDIASVTWYKVNKECLLKVALPLPTSHGEAWSPHQIVMKNGDIYKYDGFQDSNYETVKAFFNKHYDLDLKNEKVGLLLSMGAAVYMSWWSGIYSWLVLG